jgi:MFS family permease
MTRRFDNRLACRCTPRRLDDATEGTMNGPRQRIGLTAPVLAAAALLAVTLGTRSSMGQFLGPINTATALGAAAISLALAISQLAWGASQPVCGMLAGRLGTARIVAAGGLLTALGLALLALARGQAELVGAFVLVGAAGAAAGGAPLLMGAVAQRVSVAQRGLALGWVSAGSSVGQLVLGPVVALLLVTVGWQGALLALAALALAAAPLARVFRQPAGDAHESTEAGAFGSPAGPQVTVATALRSKDYWLVTAGFFVCGFHVTFLTTHMPGVIELCGLPATFSGTWLAIVGACNIAGSLAAGWLMQRRPMKLLLGALYALRALGVALFLLVPSTETTLLLFALWMGITYMATLPPTTGLIARLYGAPNVATLFGVTMAVHQVGAFLGAWLGGLEREATGGYHWVWLLDIVLAAAAALVHVPVREGAAREAPPAMPALAAAGAR